jgi:hypothetical protein
MTGDAPDIALRIRRALPRWFGRSSDPTPVLDAILLGLGAGLAHVWDLLAFARRQARLATADGGWLDVASLDFFGPDGLPRFRGDTDTTFRRRLRKEVFRRRVTRPSIVDIVTDLTGQPPAEVFEGWDVTTTGGWGANGSMAYGVAGLYGSDTAPGQTIVTIPEPQGYGIPSTPGWGSRVGGYGAFGTALRYVDDGQISGVGPTKEDIIRAIDGVRAAGTVILIRFLDPLGFDPTDLPPDDPSQGGAGDGVLDLGSDEGTVFIPPLI